VLFASGGWIYRFVFTVPGFAGISINMAGFEEHFKLLNFTAAYAFLIEDFVARKSILNSRSRGKHNCCCIM